MNLVQKFEKEQIDKLTKGKRIDDFKPGDTVKVNVKIVEGDSERVQAFEGVCIAKKNRGINSSFTVRKISHGEGVERIFPTFSPRLESINLVRTGEVRRAKLYYIRDLSGKAARIKEKLAFLGEEFANQVASDVANTDTQAESAAAPAAPTKAENAEAKAARKAAKAERAAKAKKEAKK